MLNLNSISSGNAEILRKFDKKDNKDGVSDNKIMLGQLSQQDKNELRETLQKILKEETSLSPEDKTAITFALKPLNNEHGSSYLELKDDLVFPTPGKKGDKKEPEENKADKPSPDAPPPPPEKDKSKGIGESAKEAIDGIKHGASGLNFRHRLGDMNNVVKKDTGMDIKDARVLHDKIFDQMITRKGPKGYEALAANYRNSDLKDGTWASAIYELLAKTPEDTLGDRMHSGASIGSFQAYIDKTADALEDPNLRDWISKNGDPDAKALIASLPASPSRADIVEKLKGPKSILSPLGKLGIPRASFDAVNSPLFKSTTLNMIGKMQLTLDYMKEIDTKSPPIRNVPPEAQKRIWADVETGSGRSFYLDGTPPPFQLEANKASPVNVIAIPAGSDRMHEAMDALGINYLKGNTLFYTKK